MILILSNTRKLNRVLSTNLSTLYTTDCGLYVLDMQSLYASFFI